MDAANAPAVNCEQVHPTLLVSDVAASVKFYTEKLGFSPGFLWESPPTFAGVNLGKVSVHLSQGTPNPESTSVYFVVDDVDELYAFQERNGVAVSAAPRVVPWGMREFEVHDDNGYSLRFGQRVPTTEPKIEVERVDVPVRLEARLAAVLTDLARIKEMSVSECIEEIVLHSFEKTDRGVASPHTAAQLARIQHLKKTHGLAYDVHEAYRFTDKR